MGQEQAPDLTTPSFDGVGSRGLCQLSCLDEKFGPLCFTQSSRWNQQFALANKML